MNYLYTASMEGGQASHAPSICDKGQAAGSAMDILQYSIYIYTNNSFSILMQFFICKSFHNQLPQIK